VLAVGFRYWSGEKFGQPPTWNHKAKYIQIDSVTTRIGGHVPADVPLVGDPKLVLRQLIDQVKERRQDFGEDRHAPWLHDVAGAKALFARTLNERLEKARDCVPIHPDRLVSDLVKVLDRNATVILDSFTLSGYLSHWFPARFPGQVVDAGPLAPVGHSIGMAIGVQLARPGQQVVA